MKSEHPEIELTPISMYTTDELIKELKKRYPIGFVIAYAHNDAGELSDEIMEQAAENGVDMPDYFDVTDHAGHLSVCVHLSSLLSSDMSDMYGMSYFPEYIQEEDRED